MAKKRFQVNIMSPSSIDSIIKELNAYKNSIPMKTSIFCERLAEFGVESAKTYVYSVDAIFTTELFNSIHSEKRQDDGNRIVFAVVASSEHAVFVEFGTGIIGKESPYPYPLPNGANWQYASGKTIRQLSDGRYGWFYNRDGNWYFTEGMPSRPFMYPAAMEMQENIKKIAKEVFG